MNKKIYTYAYALIAYAVVCTTISVATISVERISPKKSCIIFDIDDVINKMNWSGLVKDIVMLDYPWKTIPIAWSMKDLYVNTPSDGLALKDLQGNIIDYCSGVDFILLYFGMIQPKFQPYVHRVFQTVNQQRVIAKPVMKIIQDLKSQGHIIYYATNKSYASYIESLKVMPEEFAQAPEKVFTTAPCGDERFFKQLIALEGDVSVDSSYKSFLQYILNIEPMENVYRVPSQKPNRKYYDFVLAHVPGDVQTIFIDDKKKNVEAAVAAGVHIGIIFQDVKQFAQELSKNNLLDSI